MSDPNKEFIEECQLRIQSYGSNEELKSLGKQFSCATLAEKYSYNFTWMGRPIIQHPQDMIMMQELIWQNKPQLVIETGIAHGGSAIMYASYLEMMGLTSSRVLAIDIDIRKHNKDAIKKHPMSKYITMLEGSSISDGVINKVKEFASNYKNIMVVLDSNHTHEHVLAELNAYAPLVTMGNYCVVFDTIVEDMPEGAYKDRPWNKLRNPKTAVWEYMENTDNFVIDKDIENKLLVTAAPDGYLKKIK